MESLDFMPSNICGLFGIKAQQRKNGASQHFSLHCCLCVGRAQQMSNGTCYYFSPRQSCSSFPHIEVRQFTSSLCGPGTFRATAPVLELRVSEFMSEKVCMWFFWDLQCLCLHQPSSSLSHNYCWFSQPQVLGTSLSCTGTLCWWAQCGAGTPQTQEGSL